MPHPSAFDMLGAEGSCEPDDMMAGRARTTTSEKQRAPWPADDPLARRDAPAANHAAREVDIDAGNGLQLPGVLTIPPQPHGAVVVAQGSGSSRLHPPERAVARALNMAGFATLLFDLLTILEEANQ
jgi:hypothetical protein